MKLKLCFYAATLAISVSCSSAALAAVTGQYLFENNTNDTSGNNRHGTAVGTPTPTFTAGLYPGSTSAILQTTAGQSTMLPSATNFIRNAPGATLTAWIRADALPVDAQANIVAINNGAADGVGAARALLEYSGVSTGPVFRLVGRQADTGGSTIITGNPAGGAAVVGTTYFIAGVLDYVNGDMFLYINGQLVSSNTNTGWTANSIDSANNLARIGASADGATNSWIGAIDGVRVFDNVYGPDAILSLYQNPDVIPAPPGAVVPGDTDGDGVVEPEDLTPIRNNWRMTGRTRVQGNLTGDTAGLVDFADFRQWKTAFVGGGGSLDGLDLGFTVPEPSALIMALVFAAPLSCRRLRRRAA